MAITEKNKICYKKRSLVDLLYIIKGCHVKVQNIVRWGLFLLLFENTAGRNSDFTYKIPAKYRYDRFGLSGIQVRSFPLQLPWRQVSNVTIWQLTQSGVDPMYISMWYLPHNNDVRQSLLMNNEYIRKYYPFQSCHIYYYIRQKNEKSFYFLV